MRTASSPAPASTTIFVNLARSNVKSAVPSSPTSTWRNPGAPACRRSASRSLAASPVTRSVCALICVENAASARPAPKPATAATATVVPSNRARAARLRTGFM
jgi:hypothetical protein